MDFVDIIKAYTDVGDLVVDPFCGTASAGAAALALGRQYFGTDLFMTTGKCHSSPGSVQVACDCLLMFSCAGVLCGRFG